MATLTRTILLLSITSFAITVCSAFLSDFVKDFRFFRRGNETDEFNFCSLEADKNDTCSGEAVLMKLEYSNFYFIRDTNDTLYWAEIDYKELGIDDRKWPLYGTGEPKHEFIKSVRIVERRDDELHFADDLYEYRINLTEGYIYRNEYATGWNLKNICFTKANAENQTQCSQNSCRNEFHFKILSDNNSRNYTGMTYIENGAIPNVQHLKLKELWHTTTYEVEFTTDELHSNGTFCKDNIKFLQEYNVDGRFESDDLIQSISENVLKSMVGNG